VSSIGLALTDTLDDLISDGRLQPQLAMKILANFDRSITEVLAEKVKARLTFKVCDERLVEGNEGQSRANKRRAIWTLIGSAMKSGRSKLRMWCSKWRTRARRSRQINWRSWAAIARDPAMFENLAATDLLEYLTILSPRYGLRNTYGSRVSLHVVLLGLSALVLWVWGLWGTGDAFKLAFMEATHLF